MKPVFKSIIKVIGIVLLSLVVLGAILFYIGRPKPNPVWGITFSSIRAEELGFKPQELLKQILADLHPQKIRIPAYWSVIEPKQNEFDFSLIDALVTEAKNNNTEVVLVVGNKQPRWPECHAPLWVNNLSETEQQSATLNMIEQTVAHFKNNQTISAWQIENEPFFQYGPNCPAIKSAVFKSEIATVRRLDSKPIIATDSGEKGAWINVSRTDIDLLGSTMYREVYYEKQDKYVTYPMPWWGYNIKAGYVKLLTGKVVIGVELQTEPWLKISNPNATPPSQQLVHMNPDIFNKNIQYATKVGFSENYLWGVEWWYWLQKTTGDNTMITTAKNLFNK